MALRPWVAATYPHCGVRVVGLSVDKNIALVGASFSDTEPPPTTSATSARAASRPLGCPAFPPGSFSTRLESWWHSFVATPVQATGASRLLDSLLAGEPCVLTVGVMTFRDN
jgi:hypothetical protein